MGKLKPVWKTDRLSRRGSITQLLNYPFTKLARVLPSEGQLLNVGVNRLDNDPVIDGVQICSHEENTG